MPAILTKPRLFATLLGCLGVLAGCNSTTVLETSAYSASYPSQRYGDKDPVRFKGLQPKSFQVHGIDLSRYNTKVDWPRVNRSGIKFAFIKATEGKDDRDVAFKKHWKGAARAGIPRSAYHFYYFCASPEAQARNYINAVPKSEQSLPPVLDVEWNPKSPTCRKRPSPAKVRNVLKRWLDKVESHYGQKPIIYVTVDFYADNFANGALPGYQYWLRSVTADPSHKYGNRPWKFWQYTGTGVVPGIKGEVDINVFNGTERQWKRWVAKNQR